MYFFKILKNLLTFFYLHSKTFSKFMSFSKFFPMFLIFSKCTQNILKFSSQLFLQNFHFCRKIYLKSWRKFLIVSPKFITNFTKTFRYNLLVNFLIYLKLSIFFDWRISSKFTLRFFKIHFTFLQNSLYVSSKFSWKFLTVFSKFFEISPDILVHKDSLHFFQISPWFFKFSQNFSKFPKTLQRLHEIFSRFSSSWNLFLQDLPEISPYFFKIFSFF